MSLINQVMVLSIEIQYMIFLAEAFFIGWSRGCHEKTFDMFVFKVPGKTILKTLSI